LVNILNTREYTTWVTQYSQNENIYLFTQLFLTRSYKVAKDLINGFPITEATGIFCSGH